MSATELAWSDVLTLDQSTPLNDAAGSWRGPNPQDLALTFVPLSESELLAAARSLPIAVRQLGVHVTVGAIVANSYIPKARRGTAAWSRAFAPLALRLLPFSSERADAHGLAVLTDCLSSEEGTPLRDGDGELTKAVLERAQATKRWHMGVERLGASAEALLAADLLRPFAPPKLDAKSDAAPDSYLSISPQRFDAITPFRAAALARRDILSVDLAGALRYAQRHSLALVMEEAGAPPALPPDDLPDYRNREIPLMLDGSDLIDADGLAT